MTDYSVSYAITTQKWRGLKVEDNDIIQRLKSVASKLSFGTSHAAVLDAIEEIKRLRLELEERNHE